MNVDDNREAKDAFLWLPTSFGKSIRYKVLSFACLIVKKASWGENSLTEPDWLCKTRDRAGVATPLSCLSRRWGHLRFTA